MDKKSAIAKIKQLAFGDSPVDVGDSSIEAVFARCFKAFEKALGVTPFDEQLSCALSLSQGRMVQMQTGEGKTFCAVFAACHEAAVGGSVHILTFSDYLAERDYSWMKPVFDEMGVSVGCITEKTPRELRSELYSRDVVYLTAREAGFDYLRDFVCFDADKMCFPEKPNFAIVDEADSILIDEARLPLVIAGDIDIEDSGEVASVYEKTSCFTQEEYGVDDESRNVYLTDSGADKAEEIFGCDIYAEESAGLLAKICACIKARCLLTEDKDYIVKDGAVVLIDEFTGRAAVGRVFPGDLQAAVEAKHGLKITSRGRIMGNIALQFFIRRYAKISGMTGTAEQSKEEFEKLYALNTDIIPTRLECRRTDKPLELYYNAAEKRRAIIEAIAQAAKAERPVLVGTQSIEESESIAAELRDMGIQCSVLNAKNDAAEAAVIAAAGKRGAVTVSTNMAGRGVDIKLGGEDSVEKEYVSSVGGLLVLATSMRESSRMTKQLRGRAGRQGDVGESRFFAALDDEMMTRFDLKSLVSPRHYPTEPISGEITDKPLIREANRIQRICEGEALDDRMNLLRYTAIGEKHRELTFRRRKSLLDGSYNSDMWQKNAAELYDKAVEKFGRASVQAAENLTLAALINEFWCDYLDYTAYLREGIHLTQIAGRNPAEEYNIACEEYYDSAAESLPERMAERLVQLLACESAEDYKPPMPSRTYTYLLNDGGEEFKKKPILTGLFSESYSEASEKAEASSDNTDEVKETAAPEKKQGIFSRLFGKGSKS